MRFLSYLLVTAIAGMSVSVAVAQSAPAGPAGHAMPPVGRSFEPNRVSTPRENWAGGQQPYPVQLPQGFKILQPMASAPKKIMDEQLHQEVYYIPNVLQFMRWGILPNKDAKPIITVPSGSLVQWDIISHEGVLEDQGRNPIKFFGRYGIPPQDVLQDAQTFATSKFLHNFFHNGPHIISPPVGVQGAQPGDVLKIDVVRLEPRVPYGVNSIRHGLGSLPNEFPLTPSAEPGADEAHPEKFHNVFFVIPIRQQNGKWMAFLRTGSGKQTQVPFEPFIGIMGVAEDTPRLPNSVPPGHFGGNLDLHNLTVGSSLYLPVLVPGAQFYVSDSHFGQGNGEVSLTAIEGSLRATLRLTLLKNGDPRIPMSTPLVMPFAENSDYWIPIGISGTLDAAMQLCIHQAIEFLTRNQAMKPDNALAFLSIGANFNISEVVDRTLEIHAMIPKADFPWVSPNPQMSETNTAPEIRP